MTVATPTRREERLAAAEDLRQRRAHKGAVLAAAFEAGRRRGEEERTKATPPTADVHATTIDVVRQRFAFSARPLYRMRCSCGETGAWHRVRALAEQHRDCHLGIEYEEV